MDRHRILSWLIITEIYLEFVDYEQFLLVHRSNFISTVGCSGVTSDFL